MKRLKQVVSGFLFVGLVASSAAAGEVAMPALPVVVPISADGVQRATIILDSYSYSPGHLIVEVGKPVELLLTSVTIITPHNFIIKELAIEQDVGAGKTIAVTFTPTQVGTFAIYCDKKLPFFPSHREKGMGGKLEVR